MSICFGICSLHFPFFSISVIIHISIFPSSNCPSTCCFVLSPCIFHDANLIVRFLCSFLYLWSFLVSRSLLKFLGHKVALRQKNPSFQAPVTRLPPSPVCYMTYTNRMPCIWWSRDTLCLRERDSRIWWQNWVLLRTPNPFVGNSEQ